MTDQSLSAPVSPPPADAVLEKVIAAVARAALAEAGHGITEETELEDSKLGLDSLDRVEIAMDLEEVFEIELADDEIESPKTVADLVKTVREALAKKEAANA